MTVRGFTMFNQSILLSATGAHFDNPEQSISASFFGQERACYFIENVDSSGLTPLVYQLIKLLLC